MLNRKAVAYFSPIKIELLSELESSNFRIGKHSEWYIRDESQLAGVCEKIKRDLKQSQFYHALDTALAVAGSFLAAQAGTAPTHYPIFSSALAGDIRAPERVVIEQNKVKVQTLTEFLSRFIAMATQDRPNILISYHDRKQVLELLAKISSLVEVRQLFGRQQRLIALEDKSSENNEIISFVTNGNHLPNLNRYLDGDDSILLGWAAAKSSKLHDVPGEAETILLDTIAKVRSHISVGEKKNRSFWLTLYIQLLLDLAFFRDGISGEAHEALLIARQLDDSSLIAHCERFSNQTYGVGQEALATLNDSYHRFKEIPENSEEFLLLTPSRLATVLNRNTTMLTGSTSPVDPGAFEADYYQAKEIFPSYSNIGMLASAAGVAALVSGHKKKAEDLLKRATLERSLPIDGFNLRMNLLIAQFCRSKDYEEQEFISLCNAVKEFPFSEAWEYHRVRIAVNLIRIAQSSELSDLAWSIIDGSSFISEYSGGIDGSALQEYLINKRYSHYIRGGSVSGQFGQFYNRTALFPCIDKDWA